MKTPRIIRQAATAVSSALRDLRDRMKPVPEPRAMGNGYSAGATFTGAKFPGGLGRTAPVDIYNHYAIRQQVRNKLVESVEARALVTSVVDTVIDVGLHWKPTPNAKILGITPEAAEAWAEDVAERFHLWASSKKSSRDRVNNFYQNTRFYELQKQRDNDVLPRLFYGKDRDLVNPLQIGFIDPNQLRGNAYTSTYAQTGGDDGINRDAGGREISYKIWTRNSDGTYSQTTVPAVGEKSGRYHMLHGFNPEYPGQGRGYSKLAHLIQELTDLTGFKHSTIQTAINQASIMAAVQNDQQDASQPLAGRVAGPVAEYGSNPAPAADAQNVTPASTEPAVNWSIMPEATLTQPSTLIGNLKRGDKLEFKQMTSPSAQYDKFVESFFSYICASTGWSAELVLKKFNANYSASRGTLLLCWRTAEIERQETVADFCGPVVEMWLAEEIAAGRVQATGWSDPYLRQAWLSGEWAGAPMPNIDPQKTMQAERGYVEMSAMTLDDVARNLNGSSGKMNRLKNARQFAELPPPPWSAPTATTPGADDGDGASKTDE